MFVDLHIHSRFSYATSKFLDIHKLALWSGIKGLGLLASADITHPVWRKELQENLIYNANTSFYEYKSPLNNMPEELKSSKNKFLPANFILQGEISCVYKQNGKVRKVHCLVYFPNFNSAERFCLSLQKLAPTCNFSSDGRATVKISARNLLELALENDEQTKFIPAHIWTPHFSLFGSKSGFDSLQECFADLSEHIFALESGLSSDPQMNSLISKLDSYSIISNSDAHSAENLAREVNIFSGTLTYDQLFQSLKKSQNSTQNTCKFAGTLEFYAQEGKYYNDGHRNCEINYAPWQSAEHANICPVCHKELTLGVLHRIYELADRDHNSKEYTNCQSLDRYYQNILPLNELIAQSYKLSKSSKKVTKIYFALLANLGSELDILTSLSLEQISAYEPIIAETIHKMRTNQLKILAGYDGEYGKIY